MATVEVKALDAVRRRLDVEVAAAEVAGELERVYEELRRTANVRGFRRGRVPRPVLERLFADQVRADVYGKLVRRSLEEALREQGIEPVGPPEVVTQSAEPGAPLKYSATLEVKPEVVVNGYDGLEAERPLRAVSEDDVEAYVTSLRESFARLRPVEDRAVAEAGDMATIDFEARIGDRVVGHGHDRLVEVGGDPQGGALGTRLAGLPAGRDSFFDIDYAADHSDPALAGQRVSFRVCVKSLGIKEVPALDDDFARERTGCESVAELRGRVRQHLESAATRDADTALRSALIDRLVEANDFEVPRAMVGRRTEALVEEVMQGLGPRRPPASREAEVKSRLRAELEPRARDQVKAGLILEAIAAQEHLAVGPDEIDAQIERIAEQAGEARERVRALYGEESAREGLRDRMLQERALGLVVERARVRTIEATSGVAGPERNS